MEIEVIWTDTARLQLEDIFLYYKENASLNTARKLIQKIIDRSMQLASSPESGQIEPLLQNRKFKYRYLVEGNYKIIYLIDSNCIAVVSVFDCRQNPIKLKNL